MTVLDAGAGAAPTATRETILEARDLVKEFPIRAGLLHREVATVKAVTGVSFSIAKGQTLGLVGESGCGKSTTGRMLLKLLPATSGSVRFRGQEVLDTRGRALRQLRAMRREGMKEKQRNRKEHSGDESQAEKGQGIAKNQPSLRAPIILCFQGHKPLRRSMPLMRVHT